MSVRASAATTWRDDGGRFTTGRGELVFVRRADPADGELAPPLVLLHGAWRSSFVWRQVWDDLNRGRRLLAPDLLGHGLSAAPWPAASLSDQADVVEELVADAGWERIDLLSHGLGNIVSAELLARRCGGTDSWSVRRRVMLNGVLYPELVPHTAGVPARHLEELRRHRARWTAAIEEHPAPVTLVWGDGDAVAGAGMAERLRAARPDAGLVRLPGAGHAPQLELPSSVARVVLDVLS